VQVIIDFPTGSEFGIDYASWQTGSQFIGMKMIPPGIHIVYYRPIGKINSGDSAPRIAFVHEFKVRKADCYLHCFHFVVFSLANYL
jgi:hypothetical protein